jgi:prephenate dehydrogenase
MIRVAKSSPFMWSDIFKQNKNNVVAAINMFEKELNLCKDLIKDERWDELFDWMSEARAVREIL